MKILVAEDEPMMLMTIVKKLQNDGYDVTGVADGREALKSFESDLPDLVITDILMPYTSGLELIGIVKNGPGSKIPIIVLSGIGEESTVMEAFELGADDFITKPFNPAELSVRVKHILKNASPAKKEK